MIRIERFRAAHLAILQLQDAQSYFHDQIRSADYAASLERAGQAYTALDGDQVVACAGVTEIWPGRAVVWSLIGKQAGRHMVALHRVVMGFLSTLAYGRLELWVDDGFAAGLRWAKMLGFACETPAPMQNFRPGGNACYLFSRIQ